MKGKSNKPHLLCAQIGPITHRVAWYCAELGDRWLIVSCEMARITDAPRHYPVPFHARLVLRPVDCMSCLVRSSP